MGASSCLPHDKELRRQIGEYFKRFNYPPRQEDLDVFVKDYPEFGYNLEQLTTKRRTLITLRVFDPATPEEVEYLSKQVKRKKKLSKALRVPHPAEGYYRRIKAVNGYMRDQRKLL